MTRYLLVFLLIVSCNSTPKEDEGVASVKNENSALPIFANNYLNRQLPKWTLSPSPSFDTTKLITDLNCDGKKDFAGIFQDTIGNVVLLEIISFDKSYTHYELENYGKIDASQISFSVLPPKATFKRYDNSIQIFHCGGIESTYSTAKTSKIYFFDTSGRYNVIEYAK